MVIERAHRSLCVVLFSLLSVVNTYGFYVDITYLDSAVEQGAGKLTITQIRLHMLGKNGYLT